MVVDESRIELYKYLVTTYPVKERITNILIQIQDLLEAMELIDCVKVNTQVLGKAIFDYFEDVDKLKKYEGMSKVNVEKIYAYEAYWLIKKHPIQIISDDIEEKHLHINEKVVTFMMIAKMLSELGISCEDKNPRFEKFIKLLFYNFKYRLYTQKSLEMMISAFFCGASFQKGEVPE